MAIHASLQSIEHFVAFDKLAEDGLVAIEVVSSAKRDRELRASRVLSIVRESQLTSLIVSHGHVLVLQAHPKGTHVLLADATRRDAEPALTLVEPTADVRVALRAFTQRLERVGGLRLPLGVQLEDKVANALVVLSDGQIDAGVGGAAVVEDRGTEGALADEIEQLVCFHYCTN